MVNGSSPFIRHKMAIWKENNSTYGTYQPWLLTTYPSPVMILQVEGPPWSTKLPKLHSHTSRDSGMGVLLEWESHYWGVPGISLEQRDVLRNKDSLLEKEGRFPNFW